MHEPVSYVMPVLDEAEHVRNAVLSILAQQYEGDIEIVLALGPSTDSTNRIVAELIASDPRIRSVPNPTGGTPAGLNAAIRATTHPIVVRVDAHTVLPQNYTAIAVEAMQRTGAGNVGGVMDAVGRTPFERAVALAYTSRVGLGGGPHHIGGEEGPAETVYLGTFRRDALEDVGLFDERIRRGQDWELNRRLRAAGHAVWFTPAMRVVYRPRSGLNDLVRQFAHTGRWRGELVRRFPAANSVRYFIPPVMVVAVVLGTLLGVAGIITAAITGTFEGAAGWLQLAWIIPAVYILFVLGATVVVGTRAGVRGALWFAVVLPFIHFAWGTGFILGLLKLTRSAHPGR